MPAATSHQGSGWTKPLSKQTGTGTIGHHRQPFAGASTHVSAMDRSFRSGTVSEHSDSGNEVEQMLLGTTSRMSAGWGPGAGRSRPGKLPGLILHYTRDLMGVSGQRSPLLQPNVLQGDSVQLLPIRKLKAHNNKAC